MTLGSTVVSSVRALGRNPTRALLTTLGIVIGIGAVITMMEIGNGSAAAMKQNLESMGANTLVVIPGTPRMPGGVSQGQGSAVSLTPDDCEAIRRDCLNISAVAPVVNAAGLQFVFAGSNWTPRQVVGSTPEYFEIRNWQVETGRLFTQEEVESRARVCVIGSSLVKEVFGGENPVGTTIRLRNVSFTVVGVLKTKGANMMGMDEDDVVVAPWTTIRLRITGLKSGSATNTTSSASTSPSALYPGTGVAFFPEQAENLEADTLLVPRFTQVDQIMVSAIRPEMVGAAQMEMTALLRDRHKLGPDDDNDFWVRNTAEFMATLSSTTTLMSNLLLVVALISLIVGGVGIMNIMLVSVTERTREIGLRMAVGARSRDILQQFLTESIILCAIGGIVGILLGHGAALMVNIHLKWPIESSPAVVVAAFLVSASVGIIFGFYPAWKASRLDPIEALRYE